MKKIFLFALLLISLKGFSQYPAKQTIGTDSTEVNIKGATKTKLINYTFTDTTAANLTRIKQYPGAQIFTSSDNKIWFRNSTATAWLISSGNGVSIINIITDSSISICNFNSCDTFYTTITAQLVTIINDSTLRVCDTLFNCDTLHVPKSQFAQTLWDSATIYALVNTKLTASDTTGKWLPFQVVTDTSYFLPNSADSIRRTEYTDGTVVDDTLTISIVESIINNITTIINAIDSIRSDTSFYISTILNGDTLLKVRHNPNNRNDTIFFTLVHGDATHAGYVSAGGSAAKVLHGDGVWRDTTAVGGSQTLQQVFDQETGEARLNKNDTINVSNHTFFIKDDSSGSASLNYRFDSVSATGKSTVYTQNSKQITLSAQNNLAASIVPSLSLSATTNSATLSTQAGSTLTKLVSYKDSLTVGNNTKTFLKFTESGNGDLLLPQYTIDAKLATATNLLGTDANGKVVQITSTPLLLEYNYTTNPVQNILNLVAGTGITITNDGTSEDIVINATAAGGSTTADSVIVATSLQTVFPFTSVPASKDDFIVTVWGVLVDPDLYTISGGITFLTGLDAGDKVRYHRTK